MLRKVIGNSIEALFDPVARKLHGRGVSPNILTLTGLVINGLAAYIYFKGYFVLGGLVILFAGLFDMLDGAVARAGENATQLGGFLDSVIDRYSDFLIFGGVLAHFAQKGAFAMTVLVLFIICGAFMVSYVRARAELVIPKCDVGLLERPERIIILAAGSLFNLLEPALWLLAILTHITAGHRIFYTHRSFRK